jgi:hypothetical protein
MIELGKEEEEESKKKKDDPSRQRARPNQASGRRGGGQLGGAMLMLGLLSVLAPQGGASAAEKRIDYDGLQGLLKSVAMGLELVESVAMGVELVELEKTIQQRQKLLDLMSRVIEDGIIKLGQEKKAQAELAEKPPNCRTVTGDSGELAARKDVVFGLQMMGVFTLCGVLATLSWGEVTSILVIMAKAWTTKPSQGELGCKHQHKHVGQLCGQPTTQAYLGEL